MISLGLFVLLQISVAVWGTQPPNHGTHHTQPHTNPTHTTTGISSGVVDAAIVNINTLYTDALCLELLLVDCATHVTKGDEQVCGSNGITYDNHCHFTHAVCETLHYAGHKITLKSHGACPNTTAPQSTVATVTVAASATTTVTHGTGSVHTDASTTFAPTTTTSAPTTTDPTAAIVQNVFCSSLGSISCSGGFDVICGSDGNYYPNQCELSKAKCHDDTLTIVTDTTKCQANVGGGK
ncbi:integumentary mucin C.1-like [Dreissena polymorpha]|uniref:Kazal-like domain-containing protein n=1 Tax=Dreissena polymorpha TaxID=45954 RepID=A0A9D4F5E9_DREPO|nr:integumentary mucin C.1-like [Dreissena polymorpha]KAH3791639.1 hypothetical protein DPMN_145128 [Dreissena polymorpha]